MASGAGGGRGLVGVGLARPAAGRPPRMPGAPSRTVASIGLVVAAGPARASKPKGEPRAAATPAGTVSDFRGGPVMGEWWWIEGAHRMPIEKGVPGELPPGHDPSVVSARSGLPDGLNGALARAP